MHLRYATSYLPIRGIAACGISRGRRRGIRTRCLPHRAEAHRSRTCTGPETSQTTAQWLIRAITVATVRIERRHNMQPSAALAQEVVATRTTELDRAIYARVGVRNRRDGGTPVTDPPRVRVGYWWLVPEPAQLAGLVRSAHCSSDRIPPRSTVRTPLKILGVPQGDPHPRNVSRTPDRVTLPRTRRALHR